MSATAEAPTAIASPLIRVFPLIISGMLIDQQTGKAGCNTCKDVYYVVVVDCGSSGSRVHAYKFVLPKGASRDIPDAEKLNLDDELYFGIKPGLSNYVDNPEEGAQAIVNLIKQADVFVPKDKKAETPLVIRATAGVRALPPDKAANLLDHVHKAVMELEYAVNNKSVKILKDSDEGIYMWYAVNLLTDNIARGTPMASLEMGGASAQITYALKPADITKHSVHDVFVRPAVFSTTLFSHSFLGQGIGAARFGSLHLESANPEPQQKYLSVCVDPAVIDLEVNFFGHFAKVSGISRKGLSPEAVFTRCREIVQQYVNITMRNVNIENIPTDNGIAAMGYFYYFANGEGFMSPDENGEICVHKIMAHAISPTGGCATSDVKKPWRCFDAVYIVSLLQDGYGIDETTTVDVYNDIDGYGVEWSLGLAYNYVMSAITSQPGPAHIYDRYIKSILSKKK